MPEGIKPVSILIVEDDLSFALELEMLVQAIGYDVAGVGIVATNLWIKYVSV